MHKCKCSVNQCLLLKEFSINLSKPVKLNSLTKHFITSNQIKSLLLSHYHSTSALVSEILMSVLQTVQKKQQTIYIWTGSAKKIIINKTLHWSIYSAPDSAKKKKIFTYGQTVQKNCTGAFTVLQTVQKKQQQFTYGQYIFTDCTEDNVQNTHTYTQYT